MYKKFALTTTISLILVLLIFAGSIIIFDPMLHYHSPILNMKPYLQSELQQNSGLSKHLEYDSILLGSSTAENFQTKWFDEKFGCDTVKLTYQAAKIKNYSIMLENSFGSRDIKNVFISLDLATIMDNAKVTSFPLPEYLYDDNIFNDVNYVLNKDVFFDYLIPYVQKNIDGSIEDISKAYAWGNDKNIEYSKEAVSKSIIWDGKEFSDYQIMDFGNYVSNTIKNINNVILPYVIDNPDTNFYIFYPPYSIASWVLPLSSKQGESYFACIEKSMELLLPYENVEVYYFQDQEDIIYDYSLYKDYSHYAPSVNKLIVDNLCKDEYLVSEENYLDKIQNMKRIVDEYDFSQLKK